MQRRRKNRVEMSRTSDTDSADQRLHPVHFDRGVLLDFSRQAIQVPTGHPAAGQDHAANVKGIADMIQGTRIQRYQVGRGSGSLLKNQTWPAAPLISQMTFLMTSPSILGLIYVPSPTTTVRAVTSSCSASVFKR
jgi:hypothetical protein